MPPSKAITVPHRRPGSLPFSRESANGSPLNTPEVPPILSPYVEHFIRAWQPHLQISPNSVSSALGSSSTDTVKKSLEIALKTPQEEPKILKDLDNDQDDSVGEQDSVSDISESSESRANMISLADPRTQPVKPECENSSQGYPPLNGYQPSQSYLPPPSSCYQSSAPFVNGFSNTTNGSYYCDVGQVQEDPNQPSEMYYYPQPAPPLPAIAEVGLPPHASFCTQGYASNVSNSSSDDLTVNTSRDHMEDYEQPPGGVYRVRAKRRPPTACTAGEGEEYLSPKEVKRRRNREAATRYRQRIRDDLAAARMRCDELEMENQALRRSLDALQVRVKYLEETGSR